MKIAYLHGLESSIDPKDPKIVWLNNNFKSVYTPKIDYKKKGSFGTILRTIKNMDPHYIVGSSMGGYFAYLIGSKLGIKTILFNPAVVGRSFDPFVGDIDTKGRNGHNLFLGKSDNVINGDDVRKFFGDSGMANVNTEYYSGGHRVPVDVFINSIKKVSGVNEIYNNIQNKHKVMKKFDQFVNEKTSLSQLKKIIKTKEYREISRAFDGAEEVGDIWNMLDPKMFKFTESEFEDIFDDWWNDQSYDSLGEFATGGSTEDMISLYNQLLPYVIESVVTEKREDVGKYNTVKKAMNAIKKEYGPTPTVQSVASFINDNYYDVTEVERGDDDPRANDKIADLVATYKFDIEEWETAWEDAQNESVVTESEQHSLQTNKINESETVYHKYDFEGMWAQKLGMTREEYVAHFATMTVGVDESSVKDYNGIQFDVKGINFTYTDVGRFYGASIYDVPKTANVSKRAKFSLSEITQFLTSIGIKNEVPVRYDTKDLDKICKKLAKQGIVCDHDDSMDVS